jgi:hypothetical protein
MTRSLTSLGLIAAGLLLAGCASTQAATESTNPVNGMAGSVNGTGSSAMASGMATTARPSASALMVCGNDIRAKVRQVLALTSAPAASDGFANGRYTCTYRLPPGPLVLSVQQSLSTTAANQYFAEERARLRGTSLPGLGTAAFGTATGAVVVVKDNETLTVDATGMPSVFGKQRQRRTDLAYEIASDVLGCWTGDGDE